MGHAILGTVTIFNLLKNPTLEEETDVKYRSNISWLVNEKAGPSFSRWMYLHTGVRIMLCSRYSAWSTFSVFSLSGVGSQWVTVSNVC